MKWTLVSMCVLPLLFQVNIVPVIAKADTFTPEECTRFKKLVSKILYTVEPLLTDTPELRTHVL